MTLTEDQRPHDRAVRGGRALCGWSPPSLPADTELKRRVDRIRLGIPATVGIVVAVVSLLALAPHLPTRAGLVTDGLAALAAGVWCALNFWRCRHAHCLVTGPGWIALGLFFLVEAAVGHSLIGGDEQPLFLAVLGLALAFEAARCVFSGTNALSP